MALRHEDINFVDARRRMVDEQIRERGIVDERVLAAMERVPRHLFVPENSLWAAYDDGPLSIGFGQTISQPYIVACMTELLGVPSRSSSAARVSPKYLEVGTGSGYQAAVLAELGAEVWTIERREALARRAKDLLRGLGYTGVHVVVGDGSSGYPTEAPYEGIVVTAAAPSVPSCLCSQLARGGRLVIPVGRGFGQDLMLVECTEHGFRETSVLDCVFVPLIGTEGFQE
jgi:protein-L-isoaspartate(D-aspartate) O-methyltransferase